MNPTIRIAIRRALLGALQSLDDIHLETRQDLEDIDKARKDIRHALGLLRVNDQLPSRDHS
jgi:hypothetical protein